MTTPERDQGQQLEGLLASLSHLDARYKETHAGLDGLINDSIQAGENIAEAIGVMSQIVEELRAANKPLVDELNDALRTICELYLRSTEELRERIRGAFTNQQMMLVHLINLTGTACLAIPHDRAAYWLEIGLAAASIEDNRTDYRDTIIALEYLHNVATKAGIEPARYFERVAALSSEKMSEFLTGFMRRFART